MRLSASPRSQGLRPPLPQRAQGPSVWGRFPFFCLVGFVATQGFLIPVMPLPINWAMWPSLPDIFGYGLFLAVVFSTGRQTVAPFDRETIKDLSGMLLIFTANFLSVTLPFSETGVGVRFGGFTLLLMTKFLLVYWAASHIPMTLRRLKILHLSALGAFFWITLTMMADRFHLIELDRFAAHLPAGTSGKWSVSGLDSTVGPNHGQTSVAILVIAAFVILTESPLFGWVMEAVVLLLGGAGTLLTGSRQGLVRVATFVAVYLGPNPRRLLLILLALVPISVIIGANMSSKTIHENEAAQESIERQMVLFHDPLSNEGLSGRPDLWMSVLDTLNEKPIRWVIGYGIGNYAEHRNPAHSMVLQLLQDGGLIMLMIVSWLWFRIFQRIWAAKKRSWQMVALTAGLLSSALTSGIFYPNLATGWYLGFYFVAMHVAYADILPERRRGALA